jgi:hypothetical protein
MKWFTNVFNKTL